MNVLVESLCRLYQCGKIDEQKVISLFSNGKITECQKNEILNCIKA